MFTTNRLTPLMDLPDVGDIVSSLFSGVGGEVHAFPPVNVWRSDDGVMVAAQVPGFQAKDIDISITNSTLTLKGHRPAEKRADDAAALRVESQLSEFERNIALPVCVDPDQVKATLRNGVLCIKLVRAAESKPRRITVK